MATKKETEEKIREFGRNLMACGCLLMLLPFIVVFTMIAYGIIKQRG